MANQRNRRTKSAAATTTPSTGVEQRDRSERRTEAMQQRREERLRAFARQRRRRLIGKVVISAIVVLLLAGTIYAVASRRSPSGTAAPPTGVQTYTNLDRSHVDGPVTYAQDPPVGGKHNPVWQNCGFYSRPVANEHAVHSLEHGAVWITYQPNLPADQVQVLRTLTQGHKYVLVSPYPNLPAPVVASAWGKQLRLPSTSDPRLDQFVKAFEQGPQTPERGAPCSGGTAATA